jgi:Glycosyl hydrolase-like 10
MTLRHLSTVLSMSALLAAPARAAEPDAALTLGAPVTHSDWMLRPGAEWGPAGVRRMLDDCKAAGWSRVYWRALDGGRSLYRSRLLDPQGRWEEDSFWNPARPEDRDLLERFGVPAATRPAVRAKLDRLDYSTFDSLAEAVRYGHRIGLEVHAWVTVNEDDHGWGIRSRFAKEHRDTRWRRRDGTAYRSQQSFAFPEVMRYKLAVIEELLAGYDLDGLFLDWLRTGDVRDNPQTDPDGVADHGYEAPLLDGFRARFGLDPRSLPNGDDRWVRFRAGPHTEFMRSVRALARKRKPRLPVAVLVAHPWCYRGLQDRIDGNLRGLLLDVAAWAREGLIDAAVAAGSYRAGGTPEAAGRALRAETGAAVDVWLYAWVPRTVADLERDAALARRLGTRQVLFWEADYLDDGRDKVALQRAMRGLAKPPG